MNPLFTNHDITLRILSPVHVGSGNTWQRGADYVLQGETVCLLNRDLFFLDLDEREQSRYLNLLSNGKLQEVEKFILNETDFESSIVRRLDWYGGDEPREIRTLVRGGNAETYMPGSSIKGAIASVIFAYLYQRVKPARYDKNISTDLLGTFDQSVMRFIRPYDAILPESEIHQIDLFNLYRGGPSGWRSDYKTDRFSLTIEVYGFEAESNFRLAIGDGFAAFIKAEEDKHKTKLLPKYLHLVLQEQPLQFLFNLINDHTRAHIERELAFFRAYPQAGDHDNLMENLENLLEKTKNNRRSCILRMAAGSSFHGITGDWRFPDHLSTIDKPDQENMVYSYMERTKMPARYKSRKVNRKYTESLGFVELILPEDTEDMEPTQLSVN